MLVKTERQASENRGKVYTLTKSSLILLYSKVAGRMF